MFNHSRASTSGTGRKKVLDLTSKRKKRLQLFQVYSILYYKSKWKATLDQEYQEYKQNVPEGKTVKRAFNYAMDRLRDIFRDETDEVKAEVEAHRRKLDEESKADDTTTGPRDTLLRYQQ